MSPERPDLRRLLAAVAVCLLVFLVFYAVRGLYKPKQRLDEELWMSSFNSGSSGTMALKELLERLRPGIRYLNDPLRKASFGPGDALLIVEPGNPYTRTEMDLLYSLVRKGLNLYVFSEYEHKLAGFLKKKGTDTPWYEQLAADGSLLKTVSLKGSTAIRYGPGLPPGVRRLRLAGGKRFGSIPAGWSSLVETRDGLLAVEKRVGRGRIALFSDSQLVSNRFLASNDNAVFAWACLGRSVPPAVWFEEACHGFERRYTAAYFFAKKKSLRVIVQILLVLFLLVYASSVRFGRLRERRDEQEDRIYFLNEGLARLMNRRKHLPELFGLMTTNARRLLRRSPAPESRARLRRLDALARSVRAGRGRVGRRHILAINAIMTSGKEAVWP